MRPINTNLISQLASVQFQTLNEQFNHSTGEMREALLARLAERKADALKTAADEISTLVESANDLIGSNNMRIVKLNEEAAAVGKLVSDIQRAILYGVQTQNFVPLLRLLGQRTDGLPKDIPVTVPKDWEPTSPDTGSAPVTTGTTIATSA